MSRTGVRTRFSSAGDGALRRGVAILWIALLPLTGCDEPEKKAEPIRPVRALTVTPRQVSESFSHVGEIQARTEVDIGFRIEGKVVHRPVDVGSEVRKGDLLARLDDQPQRNRLRSAQAALAAAEAEHGRTEAEASRQSALLSGGYTTKQRHETAIRDVQTAQAQLDSARAQVSLAQDNIGYAELHADADGVITGVYADAGQVVSAGQKVVRIADPREREAVFGVPATVFPLVPSNAPVEVALTGDRRISTTGKVRYVSPQADPVTRTYTVRVSLPAPPPEMRLGATISGSIKLPGQEVVELPGVALFEEGGKPAVWIYDPANGAVKLKLVLVLRYEAATVLLSGGLAQGDVVVTAGVHVLRPGQKVRLLAEAGR